MNNTFAFSGDRHWYREYFTSIYDYFIHHIFEDDTVLVGDCPTGVDRIVKLYAKEIFRPTLRVFKADWELHGKAAGPIRNNAMLAAKPNTLIAVHNNLERSKGTKQCVGQAKKLGIPVIYLMK